MILLKIVGLVLVLVGVILLMGAAITQFYLWVERE